MRRRRSIWILLCLLFVAGAWFLWQHAGRAPAQRKTVVPAAIATRSPATAPKPPSQGVISTNVAQISRAEWGNNKFAGRLSNTTKPIGQLVHNSHAILLENALIDTTEPFNFVFPKNLQPQGDPGAYIVQAHGPIDNAFRALLAQAGATIVSYIPNDAYLVRAPASVAGMLEASPLTQAVVPYEPYYKIQPSLLYQAVQPMQLPDGMALNLGLFTDNAPATIQQIERLGGQVIAQTQSPFGPEVRVIPPKDWTSLATLPGVQIVEPYRQRATANDLSRATVGVAANSTNTANYLGLTGAGVTVAVDDTGIDAQHPDLGASAQYGRAIGVISDSPQNLVDTNGHGTHVAGIIAGDGTESTTVTNAPGSVLPAVQGQFRGMAPGATLFSLNFNNSDQFLQEAAAETNALISNNSWNYGDSSYDLAAASYDAATRDALPTVTGSQPVLFVFSAGNAGNGNDSEDLGGGTADSILSPATAKDVITVGAVQEERNITNSVTTVTANSDGTFTTNVVQPWAAETSTSYRVAGFSSRGNVGIGIEGTYGRYKPDVAAPGTFIISTRSEQWDIGTYFYQNPTNYQIQTYSGLIVQPGSLFLDAFPTLPTDVVQAIINVYANDHSPVPFPGLPIYVGLFNSPTVYDFYTTNNQVLIPGSPEAPAGYLAQILGTQGLEPFLGSFNFAVSNSTANPISFDLQTDVITTNGTGDYFLVLSNLDNSIGTPNSASTGPGPYYRYETGTSMAAADVSGVLALMQEFYTNTYQTLPSPAMLKAMLINGAQATGYYDYQVNNALNYEGWGLVNLPDSIPSGIVNQLGVPCTAYLQDQNPTNALATGDSQTFFVTSPPTNTQPLRITLAWTDPPGDPAAAIKLVNNLVLVVTNYNNSTNPIVYYGNDIGSGSTYNTPESTNTPPNFDSINNVQNVYLPSGAGNYSVTVMGYRVNVNAVTAQTNNVVQDYALVISTGTTNASITVSATTPPVASNPTGDQQITYPAQNNVGSTASGTGTSFSELLNQFVGANSPLLGNNTILFPAGTNGFGPNNWQVTVGQTNQWHFYVVTNTQLYSNAAFVVFNPNSPDPDNLSIPREGVFADSVNNATRPEADVDLYVASGPNAWGLTNLDPAVISNCVVGTQIGAAPGPSFFGASLGPGTSEFVVDTNSQSRTPSPSVYYIGIKSEDQMSAEYGFVSIFSQTPFSQMMNGNQVVNGVPLPMNIPDGSPTVPGKAYVFGLALYPMQVAQVTVSDTIWHQNYGDLLGVLTLNGGHPDVLNNHDSFGNPYSPDPYPYLLTYNDTPGGAPNTRPSDGPGSLNGFIRQQGLGVWMLTEVDSALTQVGFVTNYNLIITPHQDTKNGIGIYSVPAHGWAYDYVDVPLGATNLTVYATNVTTSPGTPPLELFVKFGAEPTLTDTNEFGPVDFTGTPFLNASISVPPPLTSGTWYFGIYNPSDVGQTNVQVHTVILPPNPIVPQTIYTSGDTPIPILDDAVTTDSINVPDDQTISAMDVAISVQHPRISDLVFTLISPDGTRDLLMENRGGTSTDGAGGIATVTTNVALASSFDAAAAGDYAAGGTVAGWNVTGNQVSIQTDPANAYPGNNNLLALANGTLSATLTTVPGATYTLTFAYRGPGIVGWWRGENNYTDSSGYGNNPSAVQTGPFINGEVGNAFQLNGSSSYISVPAATSLAVSNLTFESWVFPTTGQYEPIIDYGGPGQSSAAHLLDQRLWPDSKSRHHLCQSPSQRPNQQCQRNRP